MENISTDTLEQPQLSPITDNSNKDLVDTLIYNPELPIESNESYEKTASYLSTRLTHSIPKHPQELSLWLNDFASALRDEDVDESYTLADKIFTKYAHLLSFQDAVNILLVFAEHDLEKNLFTTAFVILQ